MDTQTERILLLKVPIDIVPPEELPDVVSRILRELENAAGTPNNAEGNRSRNIVLLSLRDLLRARRNSEYRSYVLGAALVLPISKSIVSGAKFLTGKKPLRYMPFNFIISLLTLLDAREYPVYLLGGKSKSLKRAERNIRSSFPRLNIIGRCEGPLRRQKEPPVMEAIRKTSPSLLLAGSGIRGGELWLAKNAERLNSGLRLWCSDLFEVFAGRKYRPSDAIFDKGLESIGFCLRNPLRFFRFFSWLRYKVLLLFYKITGK